MGKRRLAQYHTAAMSRPGRDRISFQILGAEHLRALSLGFLPSRLASETAGNVPCVTVRTAATGARGYWAPDR